MMNEFYGPETVDADNATFPQLMRIDEVARVFGCTPRTVRRCIQRGELESIRFGGGIFIRTGDVMAIISRRICDRSLGSRKGT